MFAEAEVGGIPQRGMDDYGITGIVGWGSLGSGFGQSGQSGHACGGGEHRGEAEGRAEQRAEGRAEQRAEGRGCCPHQSGVGPASQADSRDRHGRYV